MKFSSLIPNSIKMSLLQAKQEALLILLFYLFNVFIFSKWIELGQLATKPWLILVWLCGLAVLVPLAWRSRAPVIVFAIQWALTVAAWQITYFYTPQIMPLYTPMAGIPVALYAISAYRSRKTSLLALAAAIIPAGLDATVAFRAYPAPMQRSGFVSNVVILLFFIAGAWSAGRMTQRMRQNTERAEQNMERAERESKAAREKISKCYNGIIQELDKIISEPTGKNARAEVRRLLSKLKSNDPLSHAAGNDEPRPQPGPGRSDHIPRATA